MIMQPKAIIDVSALQHNVAIIKTTAPNSKILAMVKADAYGHNLPIVVNNLKNSVYAFGVAHLNEALALKQAIPDLSNPIILMSGFNSASELALIQTQRFIPVLHSLEQVQIIKHVQLPQKLNVWLKLDSGMGRYGFTSTDLSHLAINELTAKVNINTIMTHLASAHLVSNPKNKEQLNTFVTCLNSNQLIPLMHVPKSVANSAAILTNQLTHYDIIRPGLILYGISPFANIDANVFNLKPVMQLIAEVVAIKTLPAMHSIGYGGRYHTHKVTKIALLAVGYADGYPKTVPDNTIVMINNQRAHVVGAVSMDTTTIDITGLHDIHVGTKAIMWGAPENSIETISTLSGVSPYEIITGIGNRVKHEVVAANVATNTNMSSILDNVN